MSRYSELSQAADTLLKEFIDRVEDKTNALNEARSGENRQVIEDAENALIIAISEYSGAQKMHKAIKDWMIKQ